MAIDITRPEVCRTTCKVSECGRRSSQLRRHRRASAISFIMAASAQRRKWIPGEARPEIYKPEKLVGVSKERAKLHCG